MGPNLWIWKFRQIIPFFSFITCRYLDTDFLYFIYSSPPNKYQYFNSKVRIQFLEKWMPSTGYKDVCPLHVDYCFMSGLQHIWEINLTCRKSHMWEINLICGHGKSSENNCVWNHQLISRSFKRSKYSLHITHINVLYAPGLPLRLLQKFTQTNNRFSSKLNFPKSPTSTRNLSWSEK